MATGLKNSQNRYGSCRNGVSGARHAITSAAAAGTIRVRKKMTRVNERIQKIEDEIRERFGDEEVNEFIREDDVRLEIVYHRFVSRSKGIRRTKKCPAGYQRKRGEFKEVRLIKRSGSTRGFTQWHRFQFDQEATEILGGGMENCSRKELTPCGATN